MPDWPFPFPRAPAMVPGVLDLGHPEHLQATLRLRGAAARVTWPAEASDASPLAILFADPELDAGALSRTLACHAGCVVLALADARAGRDAVAWPADHAAELGADPSRVVVIGHGTGARRALAAAVDARDDGWPPLVRQVLVHPALGPLPAELDGLPPTTVISGGDDDGPHCAARLRAAGVAVDEHHARTAHDVARALASLTDADEEDRMAGAAAQQVTLTQTIDATPAEVFAAWTVPVLLAGWFAPGDDWRTTRIAVDRRVGGDWTAVMVDPAGAEHPVAYVYRRLVVAERIVFTDGGDVVTVTLSAAGTSTRLTLTMTDGSDRAAATGWAIMLDRLARFVTG